MNHSFAIQSFIADKSILNLIKIYLYFIFHRQKVYVLLLIFIALAVGITPTIDGLFLQDITDSIEAYVNNSAHGDNYKPFLIKWILIYTLWWQALNMVWRLYDYCYLKAIPRMMAHVTEALHDYVQYQSNEFFQAHLVGDISNRIAEASRSLEMIFACINEKILRKVSTLVIAIFALNSVNSIVALVFVSWLGVYVFLSLCFAKRIHKYSKDLSKDRSVLMGKIVDSIANISTVRIFAAQRWEYNYMQKYNQDVIRSNEKLQWFMLKLRYVLSLSCTIMVGFMIYYIIVLRLSLTITTGQCVFIITLCVSITDDIWDLMQEFSDLFEQVGSFNQSMTILDEYEIKDMPDAQDIVIHSPSIEFRNVTFNFRSSEHVLQNQSLYIKPLAKVGLAGFSGSGKTTFASLISRLQDIAGGSIIIDSQDISQVTQESLHRQISLIPQEPMLFHRTVRENILYGDPAATIEEVIAAAKAAHAHDFILSLPDKYDTICGERGGYLSGGQRQRIVIARAFLKKASILILDEATSALDSYTEHLIQQSLHNLMQNKTVIVIAHRLATLLNMDRILVFDQGHIVEDGSHAELIKHGTRYNLLWQKH